MQQRVGIRMAEQALLGGNLDPAQDQGPALDQGLGPLLVRGSAQNFKVTYPEDFALAEALLRLRGAAAAG